MNALVLLRTILSFKCSTCNAVSWIKSWDFYSVFFLVSWWPTTMIFTSIIQDSSMFSRSDRDMRCPRSVSASTLGLHAFDFYNKNKIPFYHVSASLIIRAQDRWRVDKSACYNNSCCILLPSADISSECIFYFFSHFGWNSFSSLRTPSMQAGLVVVHMLSVTFTPFMYAFPCVDLPGAEEWR